MATYPSHDNHDVMNNIKQENELTDRKRLTPVHGFKQRSKQEFHELKLKPSKETLMPSRHVMQMVNNERVFEDAKRFLGAFPNLLYCLVMGNAKKAKETGRPYPGAGVERARMATAFVISLWLTQYFNWDKKRRVYDDSLVGTRKRALDMLQDLVYGKRTLYLGYAGPYFFEKYPEYVDLVKELGKQATA